MDVVAILVTLICVIGIICIAMWFLKSVNPPQPVVILVYCAVAIGCIYALATVAGGHLAIR